MVRSSTSLLHPCPSPAWWLLLSDKTRSHPELGRQTLQRQWYYVSRPGRVGRCQACEGQIPLYDLRKRRLSRLVQAAVRFCWFFCPGGLGSVRETDDKEIKAHFLGAGWSSPVARQAHNLKVTGSNPVP